MKVRCSVRDYICQSEPDDVLSQRDRPEQQRMPHLAEMIKERAHVDDELEGRG